MMKVRDIMTTNVFSVAADMPLKEVATRMLEYGISGLPVVDEEQGVVGVLSETDILYKETTAPKRDGLVDWLVHYGEDPPAAKLNARTAGQAMTSPAVTITPRRSVADAAELMLEVGIDRLPVVDGRDLVGIVTRADLVRAFTRGDEEVEREIRQDVLLAKLWIDPGEVKVHVKDGYVTLEGRVDDEGVAEQILHCTQRVPGVVSVEPRLTWPDGPAPRAVGKSLA
jgi:CBS domain-containing protein